MSCPKTHHLLTEYFADDLSVLVREEIHKHLDNCADCSDELASLKAIQQQLGTWQNESVPHWDRRMAPTRATQAVDRRSQWSVWWQWLPTAASFVMLCLLLFNVRVVGGPDGFSISFDNRNDMNSDMNSETSMNAALEQRLTAQTAAMQQQQAIEMQAFLARVDERQDFNNQRLMQAVLEQTSQLNAENFERFYAYFEQIRQQDLQTFQVGYQQLADNNTETIQTVYQLADYVRFQGDGQ